MELFCSRNFLHGILIQNDKRMELNPRPTLTCRFLLRIAVRTKAIKKVYKKRNKITILVKNEKKNEKLYQRQLQHYMEACIDQNKL